MVNINVENIVASMGEASMMLGRPPHYIAIRKHRWRLREVPFPDPVGERYGKPTFLVRDLKAWLDDAKSAGVHPDERAYHNKYRTHASRVDQNRSEREARRAQESSITR